MKTTCWKWSYFWGEKKRSTSKKLGCKFVRINTSKENYDPDYEVSMQNRMQTFIGESKDRKLKENRKRIKQKNKRTRKWNELKLTSEAT